MKLKPYPKYKQTKKRLVEEIPEMWEIWKLSHVSKIYSGGTPDKSNESY